MLSLSHWFYLPVVFYAAIGAFALHQGLRPSCRNCLNRHSCPNRLHGSARFKQLPVCVRRVAKHRNGTEAVGECAQAVSSGNTAGTVCRAVPGGNLRRG
jgi:hypothetical protein